MDFGVIVALGFGVVVLGFIFHKPTRTKVSGVFTRIIGRGPPTKRP